ncbi:MAG: hypothetical protein AAFX99_34380 [Myxococcota bacterium]
MSTASWTGQMTDSDGLDALEQELEASFGEVFGTAAQATPSGVQDVSHRAKPLRTSHSALTTLPSGGAGTSSSLAALRASNPSVTSEADMDASASALEGVPHSFESLEASGRQRGSRDSGSLFERGPHSLNLTYERVVGSMTPLMVLTGFVGCMMVSLHGVERVVAPRPGSGTIC